MMRNDLLTIAFTRTRSRLKAVARHFSSADSDTADDMLQEAFCRLWSSKASPTTIDEAEALSTVVVRNIAIDSTRRQSTRRTVDIDEINQNDIAISDDDIESAQANELYNQVTALIDNALSERDRLILYLRDRDEWEYDEIAERFNTSEANIRVIISRARRTIRSLYLNRKQTL